METIPEREHLARLLSNPPRGGGSVSRGQERRPAPRVGQILVAAEGQFRMAKDKHRLTTARRRSERARCDDRRTGHVERVAAYGDTPHDDRKSAHGDRTRSVRSLCRLGRCDQLLAPTESSKQLLIHRACRSTMAPARRRAIDSVLRRHRLASRAVLHPRSEFLLAQKAPRHPAGSCRGG